MKSLATLLLPLALIACGGHSSSKKGDDPAKNPGTQTGTALDDSDDLSQKIDFSDSELGPCAAYKDQAPVYQYGNFGEGAYSFHYKVCPSSNNVATGICFATLRTPAPATNEESSEFQRVVNRLCNSPFGNASDAEYKKWTGVEPIQNAPGKVDNKDYNEGGSRCVAVSRESNGKSCFRGQVCGTKDDLASKLSSALEGC